MKIEPNTLPDNVSELRDLVLELLAENKTLANKYELLLEQFNLAQHKRFAASSEVCPAQEEQFNEAEVLVDEAEEKKPSPKKAKGRSKLPEDLPREQLIIDIPEEDKTCVCCQQPLHQMGFDSSEKLVFIPASIKVIEHIRPKYSCRHCEQQGVAVKVKIAPPEPAIIPKGIATPSLLAQIITAKFQYALPLYRQEALFEHYGISLSRQTMSRWMLKVAEILESLRSELKRQLLKQDVIHADETTLKVIKDEKTKSYIWVYCCGTDSALPDAAPSIVLFDYQDGSRAGQCAVDFLQGYHGYLQTDGYAAYEQTDTKLVGCMAHARRKFTDAQKAMGKKAKSGKTHIALSYFQKLYKIEKQHKQSSDIERHRARQTLSKPILDDFKIWLDKSAQQVPPKSATGKAIAYCLNQWHKLIVYLEDGRPAVLGEGKCWSFFERNCVFLAPALII